LPVNLPTDLLRSLAAVADAQSMIVASGRLCVTPSAVSLQIKRLEEIVQAKLFERSKKKLELTSAGAILLEYAREILAVNDSAVSTMLGAHAVGPIRIGVVQDFADTLLAESLARYSEINPHAQLHIKVGGSRELHEAAVARQLDIALFLGAAGDDHMITTRPVRWFGNPELCRREVLPMAVLERPCLFREQAIGVLEEAERPYEIVVETPSLSALRAAVKAGLGATARTAALVGADWSMLSNNALPSLPEVGYCVVQSAPPSPPLDAVRRLLVDSLKAL